MTLSQMLCLCIFTQPEALQPFHVVVGILPLTDSLLSHAPWYYGMIEGRLGSEEEEGAGRNSLSAGRLFSTVQCSDTLCPPTSLSGN